jgi:hypothetical protein|tara:strand:- start:38 stop:370 length:333 start_codon:yes stop_codon:yes gene_type:complete
MESNDDSLDKENKKPAKKKKVIVKDVIDIKTEEVLKEALRRVVREKIKERNCDDEIEAMVATCSEFLKSFIIMGYDFEGNAIKPIFYGKSDSDKDALMYYLQTYFMTGHQ